jgi:hypothetical protein
MINQMMTAYAVNPYVERPETWHLAELRARRPHRRALWHTFAARWLPSDRPRKPRLRYRVKDA